MYINTIPLLVFGGASIVTAHPSASNNHGNRHVDTTITVNAAQTFQQFDGMGFSEAFQRAIHIYGATGLSPANTTKTLDLLFSNESGAGLTILRNGI